MRARFPAAVQTSFRPNQPSIKWVPVDNPPHLVPRLKKEYRYAYSPPLCIHGRLEGEIYLIYFPRSHTDTSHSVGLLWASDQARRRDLYLTTHNSQNRQTSMPLEEFEPAIPASLRPPGLSGDPFTLIYVYQD